MNAIKSTRNPEFTASFDSLYANPDEQPIRLYSGKSGRTMMAYFPRAEVLAALGAVDATDAEADAESLAEVKAKLAEAESELGEAKASVDNWRQEVGIVNRKLAEAEAQILREREAFNASAAHDLKVEQGIRAQLAEAEAIIEWVTSAADAIRNLLANSNGGASGAAYEKALDLVEAALTPPKPFVLPTTVPARIECYAAGGVEMYTFSLWNYGELHWVDGDDWHNVLSPEEIMNDFRGHRLLDGEA